MTRWFSAALLALLLTGPALPGRAEEPMRFVHHSDPAANPQRNLYAWRLLAAALEHTRSRYGDYRLVASPLIDERPNGVSLLTGEAGLSVSIFTPHPGYEEKLIPVRIPIDRGVLGYRILLIRADQQPIYEGMTRLEDLRGVRFGALAPWIDVLVMRQAGLTVVAGDSFDGLFKMLAAGRFDAFSRGAGEVQHDFEAHRRDLPGIAIEQSLALHYPMPLYFWFRRDAVGAVMAERVEIGLREMMADGSFDQLFHQEFDPLLTPLDLPHRHVVELSNPQLSAAEPLAEVALWYRP